MPQAIDVAQKKQQAQALKDRAKADSKNYLKMSQDNGNASQDGETAGLLYEFAEKMASNVSPDDDEFVAPLISKADGLLTRGLTVSPEPAAPANG